MAHEVRANVTTRRKKEGVDLQRDMMVELRREKVRASPGRCLHDVFEGRDWPQWQGLNESI